MNLHALSSCEFWNFSLWWVKKMLEFYHVLTVCIPHARKCLKQVWIMQINDNYPRLVYKVMCLSSSRTDSINFHGRTRTMNLMSPHPYENLVRRFNLPVNYAGQIYFGDFRYWAFAVCLNFLYKSSDMISLYNCMNQGSCQLKNALCHHHH